MAIAALVLTGCVPEPAGVVETRSPSPTPEPTVDLVGFDLSCAELTPAVQVLLGGSALESVEHELLPLYPGSAAVRQAGGLACDWAADGAGARISALPAASADFRESEAAAEAAILELDLPYWKPNPTSEVGEEATRTCDAHGGGSASCTWSVLADDIWITVYAFGPLGLVEPGDDENGYGQRPYPSADGQLERRVQDVVDLIAGAPRGAVPEWRPVDGAACLARLAPGAVAALFGVGEHQVSTRLEGRGAEAAARVASLAGYALPFYAADRMGWARCTAAAGDPELTLTIAPGAAALLDQGELANDVQYGIGEDGEGYSLTRVDGEDVLSVVVVRRGSDYTFDPSPLLAQFLS